MFMFGEPQMALNKVTLSKPVTYVSVWMQNTMLTTLFFFVGFSIFCTQRLNFNFSVISGALQTDLSPL